MLTQCLPCSWMGASTSCRTLSGVIAFVRRTGTMVQLHAKDALDCSLEALPGQSCVMGVSCAWIVWPALSSTQTMHSHCMQR